MARFTQVSLDRVVDSITGLEHPLVTLNQYVEEERNDDGSCIYAVGFSGVVLRFGTDVSVLTPKNSHFVRVVLDTNRSEDVNGPRTVRVIAAALNPSGLDWSPETLFVECTNLTK